MTIRKLESDTSESISYEITYEISYLITSEVIQTSEVISYQISYEILSEVSLSSFRINVMTIFKIRSRPLLRTVFLTCTMCKFELTHLNPLQIYLHKCEMEIRIIFHHLICTAIHLNLHLVQIGKAAHNNGPPLKLCLTSNDHSLMMHA